jgi:Tfp pilus assembly protein PilF
MEDRIEKLKAFLQNDPADPFVQHALALEYIKSGDMAEARSLFETILTRDPGYIGSYYHLAKLLADMGETKAAISWYEKGLEAAKKAKDGHAYNELLAAYEDLVE